MSNILERTLAILELLAATPLGLPVTAIAADLGIPASATHRLLGELVAAGYLRQTRDQGDYVLTMRLPALGLGYLGRAGISDIAEPILQDLARVSHELVRLSVVDGPDLIWVAAAQGATAGLIYDPSREQGQTASLAYSASGMARLMALPDDAALALVAAQGLQPPPGGNALAKGMTALMAELAEARIRGFAVAVDSFLVGMAAMAVPVLAAQGQVLGCLSIAGPGTRLTPARMAELAPHLAETAATFAQNAPASAYFRQAGR